MAAGVRFSAYRFESGDAADRLGVVGAEDGGGPDSVAHEFHLRPGNVHLRLRPIGPFAGPLRTGLNTDAVEMFGGYQAVDGAGIDEEEALPRLVRLDRIANRYGNLGHSHSPPPRPLMSVQNHVHGAVFSIPDGHQLGQAILCGAWGRIPAGPGLYSLSGGLFIRRSVRRDYNLSEKTGILRPYWGVGGVLGMK